MAASFVKPEFFSLRQHPDYNEKWVQDRIAEDPTILGLGGLILKDKERLQPRAGRLDLLLQDPESERRYEVEVQLGQTDETHIIRTIEYWDIEKKRFPQYDHCAVIVAEDITSRFLNVINLFNGFIPLIAIQLKAFRLGECISLLFTTVMDELTLGPSEEDEKALVVTDRGYWEANAGKAIVSMADKLLEMIKIFSPDLELKYNKFYIGLARNGLPDNFVSFVPKKEFLRLEARMDRSDELEKEIADSGLDLMGYDKRERKLKLRLSPQDLDTHTALLGKLMKMAHDE